MRSAAVYVPAGRAAYPSTVVMGVVTARAAGVLDVARVRAAGPGRRRRPGDLGTCRLCGVERVYRMGGAQAIAALAYGTETVEPVDVIVGPGNLYVQEAKRQLSGTSGSTASPGPATCSSCSPADAEPRELGWRSTCSPRPSTATASLVVAVCRSDGACSTRSRRRSSGSAAERPTVADAALRDRRRPRRARGDRARQRASRPSTCS